MIIEGDGTMQDLLIEEGISSTDAVVALTGIDEENLLVSRMQSIYVPKTITKINRIEYEDVLRASGIDSLMLEDACYRNCQIRTTWNIQGRSSRCGVLPRYVEALESSQQRKRDILMCSNNIKPKKNTLSPAYTAAIRL